MGIEAEVTLVSIGGADFMRCEAGTLTEEQLSTLRQHSSMLLACRQEGEALYPQPALPESYLPEDFPEILKYKGKTSVPFTKLLMNLAWCVCDAFPKQDVLTVLDPMCSKGTTLYCALQRGWNAIGLDKDEGDLTEADRFVEKYLQFHQLKHSREKSSLTAGGKGVQQITYSLANSKEAFKAGDTRFLQMIHADGAEAARLLKKKKVHMVVADLPYGIQHAPLAGQKPESFTHMLQRMLPQWREALVPGGTVALSFNELTLKRSQVLELMAAAGLSPMTGGPWEDFLHPVEQAVNRNLAVGKKTI